MIEYNTNPDRRCCLCTGREVIKLENNIPIYTSLDEIDGKFFCKDKEECKQNIEAENTTVEFGLDDKGNVSHFKVSKFGEVQTEVDYDG